MPLFTPADLSTFLQYTVPQGAAVMAERVVDGWLKGATGVDAWPDPLPAQVFSWAIELGAIAHENPGGLSTRTAGDETDQYHLARRAEILAAAAAWTGSSTAAASRPRGSFPPPSCWPDPARPRVYPAGWY